MTATHDLEIFCTNLRELHGWNGLADGRSRPLRGTRVKVGNPESMGVGSGGTVEKPSMSANMMVMVWVVICWLACILPAIRPGPPRSRLSTLSPDKTHMKLRGDCAWGHG